MLCGCAKKIAECERRRRAVLCGSDSRTEQAGYAPMLEDELDQSSNSAAPIVTELGPASMFYRTDDYDQR